MDRLGKILLVPREFDDIASVLGTGILSGTKTGSRPHRVSFGLWSGEFVGECGFGECSAGSCRRWDDVP